MNRMKAEFDELEQEEKELEKKVKLESMRRDLVVKRQKERILFYSFL